MIAYQGRVDAESADDASLRVHEKFKPGTVESLVLKEPLPRVYEYTVVVEEEVQRD